MKSELDNKLCQNYPKIFRDRNAGPGESCMHWGFECGDGWYDIIDHLCYAATHTWTTSIEIDEEDAKKLLIKKNGYNGCYYLEIPAPTMVAAQVKEKFGTLRFYYDLELEPNIQELYKSGKYPDLTKVVERYQSFFDGIVHMAESMSSRTCEESGKVGELHVSNGGFGGWYKTLNEEVAKTNILFSERNYVPRRTVNHDEGIVDLNEKSEQL